MYYCGWDGGGTKTAVYAVHPDGKLMASVDFGPLNPNGSTPEIVENTIRDCVNWMALLPGGLQGCWGLVIGAAGVSNRAAARLVEDTVRNCGYNGGLKLMGDQEIMLAGAVEGPGAILIAGTGAICFGRDEKGNHFRTGGYGYLIDDGGSGYAIGRDILASVVRAFDGRGEKTVLTELLLRELNAVDIGGVITWLYGKDTGRKEIAHLAPLLMEALAQKDAVAQAIVTKAAQDLSDLVITSWRKSGLRGGELAYCGSILEHFSEIQSQLTQRLKTSLPALSIIPPRRCAAFGAAMLAIEAFALRQ